MTETETVPETVAVTVSESVSVSVTVAAIVLVLAEMFAGRSMLDSGSSMRVADFRTTPAANGRPGPLSDHINIPQKTP